MVIIGHHESMPPMDCQTVCIADYQVSQKHGSVPRLHQAIRSTTAQLLQQQQKLQTAMEEADTRKQVNSSRFLTHRPLRELNNILGNFQANYSDWWLRYFLQNYPQMNVTGPCWWLVSIGSGNGSVPSDNKPLPEPMLFNHQRVSVAFTKWQSYWKCLRH